MGNFQATSNVGTEMQRTPYIHTSIHLYICYDLLYYLIFSVHVHYIHAYIYIPAFADTFIHMHMHMFEGVFRTKCIASFDPFVNSFMHTCIHTYVTH